MADVKFALNPEGKPPGVHVDVSFDALMQIVHTGVRRVSAFYKIASHAVSQPLPENFALSAGVTYQFWPTNLAEGDKDKAAAEFHSWVAGCCLKELDQHLALFLDRIWLVAEIAEINGSRIKLDHVFDPRFARDTNVRSKLEKIADRIGAVVWLDEFHSISMARNSLTHGVGRVRQRDCNTSEAKLRVNWLAFDIVIRDGQKEVQLRDPSIYPYKVESNDGAEVLMKFVQREAVFGRGERIELSEQHVAEICQFYVQQAAEVLKAAGARFSAAGPTTA